MEKYISADAAAAQLRSYKIERDLMVSHNDTIDFAISVISAEVTAADVVEVVRCKDCKFRNTVACLATVPKTMKDNEFCCEGKRRDDNG